MAYFEDWVVHTLKNDLPFAMQASGFRLKETISKYTGNIQHYWLPPSGPDNEDSKFFINAKVSRGRAILFDGHTSRHPLIHKSIADAVGLNEEFGLNQIHSIDLNDGEQ